MGTFQFLNLVYVVAFLSALLHVFVSFVWDAIFVSCPRVAPGDLIRVENELDANVYCGHVGSHLYVAYCQLLPVG